MITLDAIVTKRHSYLFFYDTVASLKKPCYRA